MHTQSVSRTSVKSGKMPRLSFIETLMYVTAEDAHFFCWMKALISNRKERNGPKLIAAEWIANEWEPKIACLIGGPESLKLPNWCQLEHYLIGKLCLCVCEWALLALDALIDALFPVPYTWPTTTTTTLAQYAQPQLAGSFRIWRFNYRAGGGGGSDDFNLTATTVSFGCYDFCISHWPTKLCMKRKKCVCDVWRERPRRCPTQRERKTGNELHRHHHCWQYYEQGELLVGQHHHHQHHLHRQHSYWCVVVVVNW